LPRWLPSHNASHGTPWKATISRAMRTKKRSLFMRLSSRIAVWPPPGPRLPQPPLCALGCAPRARSACGQGYFWQESAIGTPRAFRYRMYAGKSPSKSEYVLTPLFLFLSAATDEVNRMMSCGVGIFRDDRRHSVNAACIVDKGKSRRSSTIAPCKISSCSGVFP
jgi:hypothetical protein